MYKQCLCQVGEDTEQVTASKTNKISMQVMKTTNNNYYYNMGQLDPYASLVQDLGELLGPPILKINLEIGSY